MKKGQCRSARCRRRVTLSCHATQAMSRTHAEQTQPRRGAMRTWGQATWGAVLMAQIVWTCSAYTGHGCTATAHAFPVGQAAVHPAIIQLDVPVTEVSPRFLSFAVDAKRLGGAQPYDC